MEQILRCRRRDIVLVPFPFSDQTGSKRRPALIISSDKFDAQSDDMVALAMTSFSNGEPYEVEIKAEDWKDGLYSESYVKCWAICAIDQSLMIKRIGRLAAAKYDEVMGKTREILDYLANVLVEFRPEVPESHPFLVL